MKVSHRMMITISGLIWVAVGILLTQIGVGLMTELLKPTVETKIAFFDKFSAMLGTDQAVLCLVVIALVIGFLKGKFVLEKSAQKGVHRIHQMPNPAPLKDIYNARYYILLALMMGLGMSIKYLGLANDIRGPIDLAIGFALLTGSKYYFRAALFQPSEQN